MNLAQMKTVRHAPSVFPTTRTLATSATAPRVAERSLPTRSDRPTDAFVGTSTASADSFVHAALSSTTDGPKAHARIPLCSNDWPLVVGLGEVSVGMLAPFREENGVALHDVSGVATNGRQTLLVDDGGASGVFNKVRVLAPGREPVELALSRSHADLEDITALADGSFVLTTSLSGELAEQHVTTRVTLDEHGARIANEESVVLREPVLTALEDQFGATFVDRVRATPAKAGGLNIEGIAGDPSSTKGAFVLGLRSPLVGDDPADGSTPLDKGKALLALVDEPFGGAPAVELFAVDLGGHGVRGMEYIPKLEAFVIIGGPVEKGEGYSLWTWRKGETPSPLHVDGFDGLRRPESVLQVHENGRFHLVIVSEQSGEACAGAEYNFVKAELRTTLLRPSQES